MVWKQRNLSTPAHVRMRVARKYYIYLKLNQEKYIVNSIYNKKYILDDAELHENFESTDTFSEEMRIWNRVYRFGKK